MTASDSDDLWIEKSPDDVWRRLTNTSDIATWYDEWDYSEAADQPSDALTEGIIFYLYKRGHDGPVTAECVVVTAEAPSALGWIEALPKSAPVLVQFHLTPDGGGTRVVHTKTIGKLRRVDT